MAATYLTDKAQQSKWVEEKADRAVQQMICRAKELYALYQDFGVRYQGMTATHTRFLAVTAPTTDQQVRQTVYAKFLLAAIMEWAPTNYNFSLNAFLEAGGPVHKMDKTNELCPYWESFFADVAEAVASLERIVAEPCHAFNTPLLEHISSLLQVAEMKVGWCESLLRTVELSSSTPDFTPPTYEAETYRVWNQFCLSIGNGISVPAAAVQFYERSNSLPNYALPIPLTQRTGERIWFPFDVEGQEPWIAHAQAIAQQPHHLLRQKSMQGMHADEPHLWILDKTTDINVTHFRCSLTSFCCTRLHTFCASYSPCKTWGPRDCVHIRAGAVMCNDGHCKMIDWAKYNMCISGGEVLEIPRAGTDPLTYHVLKARDDMLKDRTAMVKMMA